jgi:hypothetical protein
VALKRVWIGSPNYSSRGGAAVRLVVLHTAEGARTYQSLGSFFSSSSSAVSSHVGIDDTPNTVGEYVKPPDKAWTCAQYNPVAIQAELCAFAHWTLADWHNHPTMLDNTAAWIAEECARYGLPLRKLTASEAQGGGRGICQHVDLGAGGGGHHDCGQFFPIDDVIRMAQGGAAPTPTPTPPPLPKPPPGVDAMTLQLGQMKDGRFELFCEAQPDKAGQCGEVFHVWQDKNGGWVGAEAGKRTAKWESLGTPGQQS